MSSLTQALERVRKAFEIGDVKDFDDLKAVVDAGFAALKGDFIGFEYSFPSANVLHWEMKKCFAHAGMKRLGVIDQYECGVVYRVGCWFDTFGLKYTITPPVERCIMHTTGSCRGDFRFYF